MAPERRVFQGHFTNSFLKPQPSPPHCAAACSAAVGGTQSAGSWVVRGFLPERSGEQVVFLPSRGDPFQVNLRQGPPPSSLLQVQGSCLEEQPTGADIREAEPEAALEGRGTGRPGLAPAKGAVKRRKGDSGAQQMQLTCCMQKSSRVPRSKPLSSLLCPPPDLSARSPGTLPASTQRAQSRRKKCEKYQETTGLSTRRTQCLYFESLPDWSGLRISLLKVPGAPTPVNLSLQLQHQRLDSAPALGCQWSVPACARLSFPAPDHLRSRPLRPHAEEIRR
ncbi:apoptosis-enhancing nuclease isoform X2 [Sapajus apella]|uniref:Apoptosis-enhancing nuclease isoform X2 n=1 Tax=Sapajus apella TaxID=9515 RepID=A0A6J3GK48_SAPAP|nr:apoptosis-enhancing nuclease isoform X2 [Sapajus apella]XP_032118351.1 apoptosis-enhancing nuclease isoform X2 [Sapajus apella]